MKIQRNKYHKKQERLANSIGLKTRRHTTTQGRRFIQSGALYRENKKLSRKFNVNFS